MNASPATRRRLAAACLLLAAPPAAVVADSAHLPLPPPSLAQWYKPANERQVWLHTMFDLREALQATEHYVKTGNGERARHWAQEFRDAYDSIPRMVPEWADEVEPEAARRLVEAAQALDGAALDSALHRLGGTCNGCHNDYQATAAALYRSPDFGRVTVGGGTRERNYGEAMEELADSLNRFKIAFKDGFPEEARNAAGALAQQVEALRPSCDGCHRDAAPVERILGAHNTGLLDTLRNGVGTLERRQVGRTLGEFAVNVCARCHAVHRTLSALRDRLE